MNWKNWKTTSAGLAAMLSAAGHLLTAVAGGDFTTIMTDLPMIFGGLGLMAAKDYNVTGGDTRQSLYEPP